LSCTRVRRRRALTADASAPRRARLPAAVSPATRPGPAPDEDRRRKPLIAQAPAPSYRPIVVGVVAFGGGGGVGPEFEASTPSTAVSEVKVYGINAQPIDFPQALRDAVLASIGTCRPGHRGPAAQSSRHAALAPHSPRPRPRGRRPALVLDEGLPKSVGALKVTTPPVVMSALADRDGNIVLVTGNVDRTPLEGITVKITRTGSFGFGRP
jgi:hypothetical protein